MPFPRKSTLSDKVTEVLDFLKEHEPEWYSDCNLCQYADRVYKNTPDDRLLEAICDLRKLLAALLWFVDRWFKLYVQEETP